MPKLPTSLHRCSLDTSSFRACSNSDRSNKTGAMVGRSRASWLLLCACCIATVALLALAALRFQQATQHNPCTMTYSRPRYRRLQLNQSTVPYELLQYENGDAFKLEPHPVLFVPGSLGSYEQARSIGSVAARSKSLQLFALDLKDEPTAFHAHYVLQQAAFVNEAVKAIRALYATANVTDVPIVLVGHSYGGLAAKLALLLTNHPPNSVDLLVMLSTPVMRPAFHPDASFELVYRTMYSTWRRSLANGGNCTEQAQLNTSSANFLRCAPHVRNATLVSVSGGDRDLLVRDGITKLAGPAFDQSFSISSHDLHSVQFGIDHKAILWCNELVTAVVRGIHLWRRVPAEQRGVDFWIEQLTGEARSAAAATTTSTNDNGSNANDTASAPAEGPSAGTSAARMPYVGADDKEMTARRNQRLAETMGVLAGAVYVAAVDHLPLVLMAFTAFGCWTVSRVVLHQLLKLPLDLSVALPLMIPRLSSILHVWVLGPILAQQILPPPLAVCLMKVSSSASSQRGLGSWSLAAAAVAILFGVGALLSQQGARGISVLTWFLPKLLAFGVAIILWIAIAVACTLLSKCFAPIRALTRVAGRKMTSSREGRAWRKKWEAAAQWIGLIVPLGWFVLALASFFGTPHNDRGQRGLQEMLLVCLSILFYTAHRTFCVQWLATVLWPASGREGYQLLLAGLYFPVMLLAFPTATLASRVLFDQHPLPAVYGLLLGDLSIYLLSLIAVIAHLYLARQKPLNVPAVEQWHRLLEEWTEPQVSSGPAGSRSACLHEDGGEHAVYEISDQPCVKLAPGVYLGPMFRVAWCDCSRNPKLPSAEYCDWCRCPSCGNRGGSSETDRLQRLDEISASAAFALVVAGVSLFVPWWVGEYTFRNMFALAAMATSLAVQHAL